MTQKSKRLDGEADLTEPVVRKRLSRGERYDLILEHAIDVFGTRGYHNVSMDDIAEAAGVSKALVYQHFESKDELYLEVLLSFQRQIARVSAAGLGRRISRRRSASGAASSRSSTSSSRTSRPGACSTATPSRSTTR